MSLAIKDQKYCPSCDETKDIKEFGKCRSRLDGLKVYCKQCTHKKYKEYYYSDLEKSRELGKDRTRKHRENPEVQEYDRQNARDWYYDNKDYANARRAKWRKTPSGLLSVAKMNNKRRKMNGKVDNDLNEKDIEFLLILQNNECAKCEKPFTTRRKYTLDHILPLSKGGGLTLDNVQLLCRSCNASKSNKHIRYRPNINFYCLSFI